MLTPLSWLKEYVDITLTPKELAEKLNEAGLGVEKITKTDNDIIFELEITPNRPDLLSIIGIAREIAAIEGKKIKYPILKANLKPNPNPKGGNLFPLTIKTDPKINPRFTGIIMTGIKVGDSPKWLKNRLLEIGERPINNIVDITNYVMFELGNPIHAFDYDKIEGHEMIISQAKGGETFESVDAVKYHLPKNAVIISDKEKIIDLCGIKGGKNSGTYAGTKNIFIRVPVEIPNLIRRTSLSLGLRSDASSIFERGVNKNGTVDALRRCADLILEVTGGRIASDLYDLKKEDFKPWKLELRLERLNKILGIKIPIKKVAGILDSLNLSPVDMSKRSASKDPIKFFANAQTSIVLETTIPTYRNDLKIEEDLIEEVARLYGYNNFPKTLPVGEIPAEKIPYFKNYQLDHKVKQILWACGFSEIYTYSLMSEKDLTGYGVNPNNILRVDNPVSREYEYLRPTLRINLIKALNQNKPNFQKINLFELGKVYAGKNIDEAKEYYSLSGITNEKTFFEVKGILKKLFEASGINEDPTNFIQILDEGIFFELNFDGFSKKANFSKKFLPLPKYPPIIEDMAIIANPNVKTQDIIEAVENQSTLITQVSLLDQFENIRTFHVVYQHQGRNLTNMEISKIREKILKFLKEKFDAKSK